MALVLWVGFSALNHSGEINTQFRIEALRTLQIAIIAELPAEKRAKVMKDVYEVTGIALCEEETKQDAQKQ